MINEEILEEILIESYNLGLTKELFKEVERLTKENDGIRPKDSFYTALENLKLKSLEKNK